MSIEYILTSLSEHNIDIRIEQDKIILGGSKRHVTPDLIKEIKEQKQQIIAYLKNGSQEKKESNGDIYPLSFLQKRLFFVEQTQSHSSLYNVAIPLKLKGTFDISLLQQSIDILVDRQKIFKTYFTFKGAEPCQRIDEGVRVKLEVIDITNVPEAEKNKKSKQIMEEKINKPFDLQRGPMLTCTFIKLAQEEQIFLAVTNHFAMDGWSIGLFCNELATIYESLRSGKEMELPAIPMQYADYVQLEQTLMKEDWFLKQAEYWKEKLKGSEFVLNLPVDKPRPPFQTSRGDRCYFSVSKEQTQRLYEFSKDRRMTSFMVLLSSLHLMLYFYTRQKDIIVATAISNRGRMEIENLIGPFSNNLLLRGDFSDDQLTVKNFLEQIKETVIEAFVHKDLPFEWLVEKLKPKRDFSRNPLFQVLFTLQNAHKKACDPAYLVMEQVEVETHSAKFDLTLELVEEGEQIFGWFEYNTDLFETDTVKRMTEHYIEILHAVTVSKHKKVNEILQLTVSEKQQVLEEWNNTRVEYPSICIHELFELQADATPKAAALISSSMAITYQELERYSNQIARYLLNKGVREGERIGIYMDRSTDLVAVMLAVLKAGCIYIPIDKTYPEERVRFMLADSEAGMMVTDEKRNPDICFDDIMLSIEQEKDRISKMSQERLKKAIANDGTAYIIYTSGSTGKPKGVLGTHKGMVNRMNWMWRKYPFDDDDICCQKTASGFVDSISEIFTPLLKGVPLVMIPQEILLDMDELLHVLTLYNVTRIVLVPSLLRAILVNENAETTFSKIKLCITSGEALTADILKVFQQKCINTRLLNLYGSSEVSADVTCYEHNGGICNPILIGSPIDNTEIYILNDSQSPVPIGVIGEIYVAGDGLAKGYCNQEELTKEKFIVNRIHPDRYPFMFRTGDMGRFLKDGTIEYHGRKDGQIKIRGIRIETGEIKNVIIGLPYIKDVFITTYSSETADISLVAYIVLAEEYSADSNRIKEELSQKLPAYMIPSGFIFIDQIPLLPNGKVDVGKLPERQIKKEKEDNHYSTKSPIMEIVLNIIKDVIRREDISALDDFFEIGGHSLLMTQVISRIRKEFHVNVSVQEFFSHLSAHALAQLISEKLCTSSDIECGDIAPVKRDSFQSLSMAQQRLWFLQQLEPESTEYNIPIVVLVQGKLDIKALRKSFGNIVKRHEIMRSCYVVIDGKPVLKIQAETDIQLEIETYIGQKEQAMSFIEAQAAIPFHLEKGPLYRICLAQTGEQTYMLLICLHHIISDGWSRNILLKELLLFYNHFHNGSSVEVLNDLNIQYVDYAAWQNKQYEMNYMDRQLDYWKRKLDAYAEPIDFGVFGKSRRSGIPKSNTVTINLENEVIQPLRQLARKEGSTLFMVLLSIYQIMLYLYTGQQEIYVGSPIAGRMQKETEDLIGFFVNTLVFKGNIIPSYPYSVYLQQVKEDALEAYENQQIPFDKVVEMVNPERVTGSSPIFQVMFILQNMPMEEIKSEELTISSVQLPNKEAKFDLTLELVDEGEQLSGWFEYNADLFEKEIMDRMVLHYTNLLKSIIKNENTVINDLQMLDFKEQDKILNIWNDTRAEYPAQSIHELFELQVRATSEHSALADAKGEITYLKLEKYANQIAHYLINKGAEKGDRTAICMDRSTDMIAAILGVLKTGGVYVPLDTASPRERIQFMLRDSASKFMITDGIVETEEIVKDLTVIHMEQCRGESGQEIMHTICRAVDPDDAAYLIYTSGSTGKPKGVLGTHKGVINRCNWMWKKYPYEQTDICCQKTAVSFVDSVNEIFSPLLKGVKLVLIPQMDLLNIHRFINKLSEYKVTRIVLVPSLLKVLLEEDDIQKKLRSLKLCVTSGEVLTRDLASDFKRKLCHTKLINLYGSSEVSADITYYEVETVNSRYIPIGKPIDNTEIYILDKNRKPVPEGVIAEIYAAGDGLAKGYFHRDELTKEKFIHNELHYGKYSYMFQTGDLGRYLPDGTIEYRGRIDNQVKIRGMRIEIDEVTNILLAITGVKEVVIIPMEDAGGDLGLVAYLVLAAPNITVQNIKEELMLRVPAYMIPSHFIPLKSMPLLSNGKIDQVKLASYSIPVESNTGGEQIKTSVEHEIAAVWNDLLNVEVKYRADNFFHLGGHSLLATRLLSRLRATYQIEIELKDFYYEPTIGHIAEVIESKLIEAIDEDELNEMLCYIDGLEDEQIKELLDGGIIT